LLVVERLCVRLSALTEKYFLDVFFCCRKNDGNIYGKLDNRLVCSGIWFNKVFNKYDGGGLIELYGYEAMLSAFLCLLHDGDESALVKYAIKSKE